MEAVNCQKRAKKPEEGNKANKKHPLERESFEEIYK